MDPSATITPTVSSGYPSASSILESVPSGSCSNGAGMSLISRPVVDDDESAPLARREGEKPQHDAGDGGGDDDDDDDDDEEEEEEEEEDYHHNHGEYKDKYNLVNNVDVCVTTISSKPPTLPLREELPSLGVELVYNAKGTGMRGVRRTYRDAKRRPPPVPHASCGSGKKKDASSGAAGGGLRRVVRQTRLGRRILRTGSSGSLQSMVSGGSPSSPTGTGASIVSPPKKSAISYETYHRTTLRSPGSSVASSFKDDQESIATHSTGVCSEDDDDAASLDKIDEGTGLVPEQNDASYCRQERRKKWEDMESSNPALGGDEGPEEDAGLSYNFNDSSTSNLPVSSPTTTMAAAAAFPPPTRTSDNVAPPIPPATPMQKIEEWSEALRNACCFGYLNLNHKKSDKDEHTAPLLGISPSQDSDMQYLLDKMEEEKIPADFLQDVGIGHGPNPAHAADNLTVITEAIQEEEEEGEMYENELFALLSQYDARPEEAKELLDKNPEMASVVLQGTGRMALHELCDRGLPLDPWVFLPDGDNDDDEQPGKDNDAGVSESNHHQGNNDNARRLMDGLLGDVTNLRILLKVVAWANVKASCIKDSNSDLPLHILARRLVEWEKSWNNDDVRYFCDPSDISNSARITTIYRTMAECLEVVLRPVGEDRELCLTGGSCNVLPLHIGALFGVSYDVLRILLEQAPMVAHIPCMVHNDLNSTSSESEIFPLTLLEQREVEQTYGDPSDDASQSAAAGANDSSSNFSGGIQWSSSALESGPISNDFVRKSDLLFAYNPNILPQRREAARLRRIESMVRSEVVQNNASVGTFGDKKLSFAIESVWLFMCTFENQVDVSDHYADTVRRIVDGLDSVSLLKLVAITDNGGRELLDVANPKCAAVIKDSFQEAVQAGSCAPRCTSSSSHASHKSILKKSKIESFQAVPKDCKDSHAASTTEICNEIGHLCKTVFRLKKDDVPTSFIILPYKMKEEMNGQIALASSKDAGLAMKFAHSLVKLTDPRAILYALEKKFHERRECPSDSASALSSKQKEEIENDLVVFLSLYTSNIGYLYLLDDRTGVPMIKNTLNGPSTYPIIISNAYATVDKLLPLMQMGMTLMRGEVALKVLGQVICLGANTISPRSWIGVSQDIAKLMYCGQRAMHLSDEEKDKLLNLRDKLLHYASTMSARVQKEGLGFEDGSEWVVEMSFLRTVLEKFDGKRSYAGLKPFKDHGRIIWTRQVESSDRAGDIKIPGDYVEARYRYDAFIHTSINVDQEQGSEVSSMTSVYFEESPEANQSQPNEDEAEVPAVIIQTLSAVCEEEVDERSGDGEARGDNEAAATAESEGERVSPTNSDPVQHEIADPDDDEYTEITAGSNTEDSEKGQAAEVTNGGNDEEKTTDPTGVDDKDIDKFMENTASSGESSSSRGTYTAVALGFDMYTDGQTDEEKVNADTRSTNLSREEETGDDDLPTEEGEIPQLSHTNKTNLKLSLDEAHLEECTPNSTNSADGVDSYKRLHPGTQTIKFILTGSADAAPDKSINSGITGLSILDEEENPIEGEELGTADELLAFVSNSVQKEQEIKEKDAQIRDMQNALAAYDNMKAAEIHEKEIAIRDLTRTLQLYEEEFHSVPDAKNKADNGSVQLSMAIRSTYDGDDSTLGTDDDIKRDIATKIRAGMKAHLYDLHHTYLSRDFDIEQLRLAFHTRETEIIREKNLEISSLHKKLAEKEIPINEYEQRIEKLLQSIPGEEDDLTISTSSVP